MTFRAASEWLERHARDQFFLYIDTWDPHEPWDPPDYYVRPYYPEYAGEVINPPYWDWREDGYTERQLEIAHARYCGEISMLDRWFGILTILDLANVPVPDRVQARSLFPMLAGAADQVHDMVVTSVPFDAVGDVSKTVDDKGRETIEISPSTIRAHAVAECPFWQHQSQTWHPGGTD